jgi:DNA-binding MarR family transcriptional regulator
MKQSSVYNVLKRLENQGYLSGYQGNETNGGKRRYYAITDLGKEYLESQKKEWEYSRTLIDNLISNRVFDLQNETPPFQPSDLRPFTPRKTKKEEPIIVEEKVEKSAAMTATKSVSTLIDDAEDIIVEESEPIAPVITPTAPINSSSNNSFNTFTSVAATTTAQSISEKELEDESYKILFEEIFASKDKKNEEVKDIDTSIDCKHINDLRLLLSKEGHKVNTYSPSSNKNYMRYILTAKLNRDLSLISYLFFVLMLLAVYLAKDSFVINSKVILTLGCIGVIVPIICLIQFFANPNKRKKDNVRLNVILPICLVVYIAFLVLNIIIELLIPRGYSINSPQIYAPSIIALVIPFFGIIFAVFYKSNLYHQKVK